MLDRERMSLSDLSAHFKDERNVDPTMDVVALSLSLSLSLSLPLPLSLRL